MIFLCWSCASWCWSCASWMAWGFLSLHNFMFCLFTKPLSQKWHSVVNHISLSMLGFSASCAPNSSANCKRLALLNSLNFCTMFTLLGNNPMSSRRMRCHCLWNTQLLQETSERSAGFSFSIARASSFFSSVRMVCLASTFPFLSSSTLLVA